MDKNNYLCENKIKNASELLFRQIIDDYWDERTGKPLSHVFGPKNIDNGMPSYSRSECTTPTESFEWHNRNAKSKSVGVWAVSVEEVAKAGLEVIDDSDCPLPPDGIRAPGHCFPDFRGLNKQEERKIRALIYAAALARSDNPYI